MANDGPRANYISRMRHDNECQVTDVDDIDELAQLALRLKAEDFDEEWVLLNLEAIEKGPRYLIEELRRMMDEQEGLVTSQPAD